ncbi:MAG: phosphoserine phosphatase SerB [Desulfomicrobium sp.]|jgi:phosphoserine phosphatase|nr:phosphoserine phosphatase SerB [Desulfomicrobium sp.]NLV96817.1 phosphoserine phosphatase SerB [Desulfovibrionales bacterium]
MREIILIQISGADRNGLLAGIMGQLAQSGVTILDICQSVIHEELSLGVLIEVPRENQSCPVVKDLLFWAHTQGLTLKFSPISEDNYESWVTMQGRKRYIVTLLGRTLTAEHLTLLAQIVADNNLTIDNITRLTGRRSLINVPATPRACVEFSVRGTPRDISAMRAAFLDLSRQQGIDIGFQEDTAFRRIRRLVCFDMDSTLIQAEVIDELAKRAGVGQQVASITERAMRGELDFSQSLRERVRLLEGLPVSVLEEVADTLPLTEGAEHLIRTLKSLGYTIAILSGGFTYFGYRLQAHLGIDYVHANELEIRDGLLTGNLVGDIVDGPGKARLLREIAAKEQISLAQVIAVGDGANDLPMLDVAGLGIAFHAKPVVREGAGQAISNVGLDGVLYFLGLRDRETMNQLAFGEG